MATKLQHVNGRDVPLALARPLKISPNKIYTMMIELVEETEAKTQLAESELTDPALDLLNYSVDMGIADLAEQHDHYLYGHPKK
jgi:hypothetical protein